MARARASSSSTTTLAIFLLCMTLVGQSYGQLKKGFYDGRCSANVESVIFDIVLKAYQNDNTIVAALLRMQFHDCFVGGCDASILLDGSNAEKNAPSNGSVRGYELIDACKAKLEQVCPGLVSCADIIVIATRVAVALAKGNWYDVETGRRDGFFSTITEAEKNLPPPTISVSDAITLFNRKGLSSYDFVLLLGGGHTVGDIHCSKFLDRLYNYKNTGRPDPSMNSATLSSCQQRCPRSGSNNFVFADQTVGSEFKVDNGYYQAIAQGKGILEIDQRIASDSLTKDSVNKLAWTDNLFAYQFGYAMVKLGKVGVLTGSQGQVRLNCRRNN
ncbi:peroxidase 57-like [Chenopodium quinoa]|uniref:Peroxidase n=1 Tax=Chenopodium quinoa TaxID=63459 RepID=A0A803NCB9_CHEQI|nr:peroxidase 57-like [Chenopodium quinoa]XP_021730504.1 peroxidase 57-like [Chenopodium quinoa]